MEINVKKPDNIVKLSASDTFTRRLNIALYEKEKKLNRRLTTKEEDLTIIANTYKEELDKIFKEGAWIELYDKEGGIHKVSSTDNIELFIAADRFGNVRVDIFATVKEAPKNVNIDFK